MGLGVIGQPLALSGFIWLYGALWGFMGLYQDL